MQQLSTVCVYAGSAAGARTSYRRAAEELGGLLANRGIGVVYGGGGVGLMGALADAARDAGGAVTGVIPEALMAREAGHTDLRDLRVVGSMHERKQLMADLSDAFVALPGGIGTVEELVEAMTWTQLGVHAKPVGLLDVDGYWAPLVAFLDHAVEEGFLRVAARELLLVDGDAGMLLDRLRAWTPPAEREVWIGAEER